MLNDAITAIRLTGLDDAVLLLGKASVVDDVAVGTSFSACQNNAGQSVIRPTRTGPQTPSVYILLVGDDAGCAPCTWDSLDDLGGGTRPNRRWVTRLNDALNIIRNLPVDLIFCDLPANAEGFSCIESLRQTSGEIPVVALTDCDSPEISQRLHDLGIEDHLCRSNINPSSLRRVIRRVIEQNTYKEQIDAVLRRERLRGAILVRIAENAPFSDVLTDLNQALQREAGCEGCGFAVELKDESAKALLWPGNCGATAPMAGTAPAIEQPPASDAQRSNCTACLQSIRSGGRLLGELSMVPGTCAATNDTILAYAKLGAELTALAIERLQATESLRQSQGDLRHLSEQLMNIQETERRRIAGDLHDVIGQSLSVVKVAIEEAEQKFLHSGAPEVAAILSRLIPWVKTALGEVRRISMDLRPATIDDLGILPTLSWFFREFEASCQNIVVEPKITIKEADVPEKLKIVIFRILQEAVCNIVKHAKATHIQVILQRVDSTLQLAVIDNGAGFDLTAPSGLRDQRSGLGLSSMRERGRVSGGSYTLESTPGAGTRIQVSWPLQD